ncbi:unnamed protein product [Nesidiocoris tenuis]|uniref:Uncharacterized protein n=1 Tax=Nesidiocoris tenuis TaxID=355587 RepID=A0A6H5HIV3_9HEMI|nr:unnamed protein product [Nesidiocoris tenuis]
MVSPRLAVAKLYSIRDHPHGFESNSTRESLRLPRSNNNNYDQRVESLISSAVHVSATHKFIYVIK